MRRQLLTGFYMTIALIVLLGVIYPVAVFGVSQVLFKDNANGSFVKNKDGQVIGSSLIGQAFVDSSGNPDPKYFQPRPSAAGSGYDALASGGSNLGPSNPKLIAPATGPELLPRGQDRCRRQSPARSGRQTRAGVLRGHGPGSHRDLLREFNNLGSDVEIPVDAVTSSGSGLDPHISVANAKLQAQRVADARNLTVDAVNSLIAKHTEGRAWGFLGEKVVNVLDLNLDLDRQT